jgi:hypothetical protein
MEEATMMTGYEFADDRLEGDASKLEIGAALDAYADVVRRKIESELLKRGFTSLAEIAASAGKPQLRKGQILADERQNLMIVSSPKDDERNWPGMRPLRKSDVCDERGSQWRRCGSSDDGPVFLKAAMEGMDDTR